MFEIPYYRANNTLTFSKRVFESDDEADKGKERNKQKVQTWRKKMRSRKAYASDVTDAEWEL